MSVPASNFTAFKNNGWLLDDPSTAKDYDPQLFAVVDFSNPQALAAMQGLIEAKITNAGLSIFRQDMNVNHILNYWQKHDSDLGRSLGIQRQGITEAKYISGLYSFWDHIRQQNPGLLIDNCASGGRRLDFEALSRTVPLWRSDRAFVDPVEEQQQMLGLSYWLPLQGRGADGDTRTYSLQYKVRSGYGWSSVYAMDWTALPAVSNQVLKTEAGALFGSTSPLGPGNPLWQYFVGDYYPAPYSFMAFPLPYTTNGLIPSYTGNQNIWVGWQFDRPDLKSGLVQGFRRSPNAPQTTAFAPKALNPTSSYVIRDLDSPSTSLSASGIDLMSYGIAMTCPTAPCAKVMTYNLDATVPPISSAGYRIAVLGDSPTNYWRLNETSGNIARNSVVGGPNAVFSGTFALNSPGIIAGDPAVKFSGTTGAAVVPNLGAFPTQGTIEFWMNPASLANYPNPFSTSGPTGLNVGIRFEEQANGRFAVAVGDDAGNFTGHLLTANLSASSWHHVVLTWNKAQNTISGHFDGQLMLDNQPHAYWPSTLSNVTIGGGFSSTRYWNGMMSEIALYNSQLTAGQVTNHYSAAMGTATAATPLNLKAVALSPTSLQVNWNSGIGVTDGYYINYQAGNVPNLACTPGTKLGPVTTQTLTGLTPATTYTIAVCGYNSTPNVSSTAVTSAKTADVAIVTYQSTVLADGATNYWRLNETSGTIAHNSVAGGVDATFSGAFTLNNTGGIAGDPAVKFSGSVGAAVVPNLGALPIQGTIEFWINPASLANYPNPFSTGGVNALNLGIRFEEQATGTFAAVIGDSASSFTGHPMTAALMPATWYHVVLTWNKTLSTVSGYLNGQRVIDNQAQTLWPATLGNVTIGGGFSSTRYWNGMVSEVALYNSQLSMTQAANHYNLGKGP